MLYLQGNDPVRVQCAFVDTPEVEKIANYISKQQGYTTAFMLPEYVGEESESAVGEVDMNRLDPMFEDNDQTGRDSPARLYLINPTQVLYRL